MSKGSKTNEHKIDIQVRDELTRDASQKHTHTVKVDCDKQRLEIWVDGSLKVWMP